MVHILGNYQTSRVNMPYGANPNDTGVAFLQRGGRGSAGQGRRGRGRGGSGRSNGGNASGADASGGASNTASVATGTLNAEGATKTNLRGEPHCFHCGATSHWVYKCPQLSAEQQGQPASHEPGGPSQRRWGSRCPSTSVAQHDTAPRRKPTRPLGVS